MKSQRSTHKIRREFTWILAGLIPVCMLLLISVYAQGAEEYTLFVGKFENRTGIVNPLLDYVSDTLDFLFSRSELADIHPISPGLRSAYLRRARNEQPNVDATRLALLAAGYAQANAVLTGFYTKIDDLWTMEIQLYVIRGDTQAREHIQLVREDMYRLLDDLAAEVSERLGTGQYTLLSTPSWEAYEAYRLGHQAYYNFDTMGAIKHFQRATELDPQLAIAHAELGMSYLMLNDVKKASKPFAEVARFLQNASEQEQLVVVGLVGYYEAYRVNSYFGSMPRMRNDMAWDEPWLHLRTARSSEHESARDRAYKKWLTSVLAYARAGFYGASELAEVGAAELVVTTGITAGRCVGAFNTTGNPQFLEASLELIQQAANLDANDEYDDSWRHWQLAKIYDKMNRTSDAQQQREHWLQNIKRKPLDSLPSDIIDDVASKCLEIGLHKDALEFTSRAVELESDPGMRALYLVTVADIYLASGKLDEAFGVYMEAFEFSARGDAGTAVLSDSLLGLTRLMSSSPEFVDETRRAKLDQIMKTIESMDPLLFRSDTARRSISGVVFKRTRDFCTAMGNMGPALTLVRGMLKAETDPIEQFEFLLYLSRFGDGITESERNMVSSPESHKTVLNQIHELSGKEFLQKWVSIKWGYRNFGDESFLRELAKQIQQTKADTLREIGLTHLLLEPVESIGTGSSEFTEQFAQDPVAAGWEWVDPASDCSYELEEGGRLQITVPEVKHDLWPASDYKAPRLLRSISGEFVMDTRVSDGSEGERHGGLIVWKDKQNFVRFEIASGGNWFANCVYYGANANDKWIYPGVHPFEAEKVWLRLQRKGDRFTGYISADGENWYRCGWADIPVRDPIQVGIFGLSPEPQTTSTLFDHFRIYRPE